MIIQGNNEGVKGIDPNYLNQILKDFLRKSDLDDLTKRLEKCEKKSKKAADRTKKLLKKHKKWKERWI